MSSVVSSKEDTMSSDKADEKQPEIENKAEESDDDEEEEEEEEEKGTCFSTDKTSFKKCQAY